MSEKELTPIEESEQFRNEIDKRFEAALKAPKPQNTSIEQEEIIKLCNGLLHTEQSVYPTPKPLLRIGETIICRSGEITNVAGASKTGKTALISSAIAATINLSTDSTLGIKAFLEGVVVVFDFEMPKDLFKANIDKILRISKCDVLPEKLKAFPLRGLELGNKKELVEYALKKYKPDLVVLDTIADMQGGQNDEEGSNTLVEWIMNLADTLEFGVLTTLHFNPSSQGKTRGHLGSQLERKVYHQLKIEKDDAGNSTVTSQLHRQAPIEAIHFFFNKQENMHTLVQDPKITKLKIEFDTLNLEETTWSSYGELVETIMNKLKKGESTAKNRVKDFLDNGWLIKENLFYRKAKI